jgi:hypothetical protein
MNNNYIWNILRTVKKTPYLYISNGIVNGTLDYTKYFDILMDTIVQNGFGPTYTSRFLYLSNCLLYYLSVCIFQNINILSEEKLIPIYGSISQEDLNKCISTVFKQLYDDYSIPFPSTFRDYFTSIDGLSDVIKGYITNSKLFLEYRKQQDSGWNTDSSSLDYPNKGKFIDVTDFNQDLSGIQEYSWTPLKVNGSIKNYLTPYFGDIPLLDGLNKDTYLTFATNSYPTEDQRNNEMNELNVLYKHLTDKQKVIAEYFEGGPGSVSPPGQWNIFMYYTLLSMNANTNETLKCFYLLNTVLYNAGVVTWKIKKEFMQSRPIQDIRQGISNMENIYLSDAYFMDPNNPPTNPKNEYMPYQKSNFVTPPFPDYTSGHSAFSSSAATCIKALFNNTQPFEISFVPFSEKHKKYIAPFLEKTDDICTIYNINVKNKTSNMNPLIPNCNISLLFNTWDEIAYYSGMSRLYGGIHTASSNVVGIQLGKNICNDILKLKNIHV